MLIQLQTTTVLTRRVSLGQSLTPTVRLTVEGKEEERCWSVSGRHNIYEVAPSLEDPTKHIFRIVERGSQLNLSWLVWE